jgi:hypothetical protein
MADGGDGNVLAFPGIAIADPIEDGLYGDPPAKAETSEAWQILNDAANLIDGDRNVQHGDRAHCHGEIAKLWTWWTGFQIDAHDVAMMMMLLKAARVKTGAYNRDCYVDGAGYLSIAGELRNGKST